MRVALTGGATGIGAEIAARLKARGDEVTAFDISEPEANIDRWIKTDLSDPASIQAALTRRSASRVGRAPLHSGPCTSLPRFLAVR